LIRSMTGYGAAAREDEALRASVAIRSLNHRFLEVSIHLPRRLQELEADLKALVQARLKRGRVELTLHATPLSGEPERMAVSRPLATAVVSALRELQAEHRLEGGVCVTDVARFPGVLELAESPTSLDAVRAPLLELAARALQGLEDMRRVEGESLARDLSAGLAAAVVVVERLDALSEASKAERKAALGQRLRELTSELGLDESRLYQEVVRQVERADITEELQRLRSHLRQFRALLDAVEPAGKRLDFLAQELMREANTIGSKSAAAPMVLEVVALKELIERLREQVQNVE
jgi:uncharacterized protein (TIGR00255 family)